MMLHTLSARPQRGKALVSVIPCPCAHAAKRRWPTVRVSKRAAVGDDLGAPVHVHQHDAPARPVQVPADVQPLRALRACIKAPVQRHGR